MNITVILCTYNRCKILADALESVSQSVFPGNITWEVLVVDNNSTDQTRQTVDEFRRRYPGRIRYLFEPQPGKSYALNSGIRESQGAILAFMDDDVTVERTWLQNLTKPLFSGEWIGAGGRIVPEDSFVVPRWLTTNDPEVPYSLAPLALFDLGTQSGRLLEAPFGTNMAFRRKVFKKYGGFRTDLGPQPGSEIRNEDTEFGFRVLAAGESLYYAAGAVVHHVVSSERLQKRYFLRWWYDKGRTNIRQGGVPAGLTCCGVPVILPRQIVVGMFKWMVAILTARRFAKKLRVWGKIGELVECRRMFVQAKTQGAAYDVSKLTVPCAKDNR